MAEIGERELLIRFISTVGSDWYNNADPIEIRLDPIKLKLLVDTNKYFKSLAEHGIEIDLSQVGMDDFVSMYEEVTINKFMR